MGSSSGETEVAVLATVRLAGGLLGLALVGGGEELRGVYQVGVQLALSLRRSLRRLSIFMANEMRESRLLVSSLAANSSLITSLNPFRKPP